MKKYMEERLDELRKRYKDTADIKWLHRYNECRHILEKLTIDEITSSQAPKRSQGRSTSPSHPGHTSTDNNRRLD